MKTLNFSTEVDARVARFALRVTASLTERSAELPHGVSERLQFAREQALARARSARAASPVTVPRTAPVLMGATMALGGGSGDAGQGSWFKWASVLPLALLLAGLLLVQRGQLHEQVQAAAEVDTALLTDHLPPTAYGDPGFTEFLRDGQE